MARAAFFFFLFLFISNYLICQVLAQDNNNNNNNGNNKDDNNNRNGNDSGNRDDNDNNNGNNNNGSNNNGNNNRGNSNGNNNNNNSNNNGNNNANNNNGNNNSNNNANNNNGGHNNNGNNNANNNNGNNNGGNYNNGNNNNNNNNNANNNNDNNNGGNNNGNNNNGNNNNNNNNGNNNNRNNNNHDNFDYSKIKPVDVGVNWGNLASHPLPPKIIVQMLKDNGIKKVKLFDADANSVKALANTGIDVMVAIPNGMLFDMAADYNNAKDWVKENVTQWVKDGSVRIQYVAVGNEPFLKTYNDSFTKDTYPALKNVQQALVEAGHGKTIKATVPLNADVYESPSNLPSDGAFRKDIMSEIKNILQNLHDHDSPFIVNIYPFLSLYENPDFPVEFAFFEDGAKALQDKNHRYTNVLDGNYDTLLTSLKKAGVPDLKIIIGEIGWPTDGHKAADSKSAQKFYDGLFKKLAKRNGTPLRPGTEFDIYLFGFLDEDAKSIAPGNFERHWGIFRFDGQPKFPIDFTGRGQDKMPFGAKGVKYYAPKWCVFDREVTNFDMVGPQMMKACAEGDCSATSDGSSCSGLDNVTKISYAFNMYYQINKQEDKACDFDGLALVTDKNASEGNCFFPIQIDSGAVSLATRAAAMAATVGSILLTILM